MKITRAVLAIAVVGYSSIGVTAETKEPSGSAEVETGKEEMSLEQAIALREGQIRIYLEHNAMAPGHAELKFTHEERVKTLLKQPDGSRAFVIEDRTIKAESQDEATMKWRKDEVKPAKPDPVGSRHGFLVAGQRLADWYEVSTRPVFIAQFPAKDGATFSLTNRGGKVDSYKWSRVDEMKVQAGTFRNCFAATYESPKMTLRRTWCPGIGLVEMVTQSSGGGQFKYELLSFRGPGFPK